MLPITAIFHILPFGHLYRKTRDEDKQEDVIRIFPANRIGDSLHLGKSQDSEPFSSFILLDNLALCSTCSLLGVFGQNKKFKDNIPI